MTKGVLKKQGWWRLTFIYDALMMYFKGKKMALGWVVGDWTALTQEFEAATDICDSTQLE